MAALTPEGKVKRKVVQVLKKYQVWYFFPAANGMGRAGIPDIIAIMDGRFVGIEVKADRSKKLTVLQTQCAEQIMSAGGVWFLVCDDESCGRLEMFLEKKSRPLKSDGATKKGTANANCRKSKSAGTQTQ